MAKNYQCDDGSHCVELKEDDEETQIFFGLFVQILCRTYSIPNLIKLSEI